MKILGIIPARYASTRFPGKPLARIAGKPMIQWVYEQCKKASKLSEVVVATDDERIIKAVEKFGGKAIKTGDHHLNGTSRCAEIAQQLPDYEHIINIQGDEPLIDPLAINTVAILLEQGHNIATLYTDLVEHDIAKRSIVKVAFNGSNAHAFSRDVTSLSSEYPKGKHVGIYGFSTSHLAVLMQLSPSKNELKESLEQLRWLDNGYKIGIAKTSSTSFGVDLPEDVKIAESLILDTKLKAIKAIVTDVDGVLTDGSIMYDSHSVESKTFNVKDGQICSVLKRHGFFMGIITGRKSKMVKRRASELGFDSINQRCKDKEAAIKTFATDFNLKLEEIAYIGDDINDLPAYAMAGLSAAPQDAPSYIKDRATITLSKAGGKGVFRELADMILA
ncbi:MAG: 3-deoxy-manno-octulosonate cytidylyltransferase, partial [Bacteroidia bacterium]